jgi:hypothetical protein
MQMMHQHQPQAIVVKSRANKSCKSKVKFNNHMLQLFLTPGDVNFVPPGSFGVPRIPVYTQAMLNILAQPLTERAMQTVNILTTCFSQVPTNIGEHLRPFTTHKFIAAYFKKLCIGTSANVQSTPLDSLQFKTSLIMILSFVSQNDTAKIEVHREAEKLAKNKQEFDFVEAHHKLLKTTIEGLGMMSGMECIVKNCANICCIVTAFFDINGRNPISFLYCACIKTINFVKHLQFIQWHATVRARVPQLPFIS